MVAVPICVPFLDTLYAVTPTLSVEAFQVRLIWVWEMAVPVRLVGTEGGVVSVTGLPGLASEEISVLERARPYT